MLPVSNYSYQSTNFGARFSKNDVEILMNSYKEGELLLQDVYARTASRMTELPAESLKAKLDTNVLYRRLNVLLEQAEKVKGRSLKLIQEVFTDGRKLFKIHNEKSEILGMGETPMRAMEDSFVLRQKYELAPKFWGDKIPERVVREKISQNPPITEEDVFAKALN